MTAHTDWQPGVYRDVPMETYLDIAALSAGVIKTLVDRCPAAAWYESWLNSARVKDDTTATDLGTIAHGILLEGSTDKVVVIDPRDHPAEKTGAIPNGWTNKSIRAARDEARASGCTPILLDDMNGAIRMVEAAQTFIASLEKSEPAIFTAFAPALGESEVVMIWREGETLCKLRTDRITIERDLVIDYKTSGMSVEPDRWGRTQMVNMAHYVGAAWYRRGVHAVCGVEPAYVYLAQEVDPPHLCSLIGVDPAAFALGDEKIATALKLWAACVERDSWPAYPNRVCYPALPPWEATRWEERQIDQFAGYPYDPAVLFKKDAA